MEIAKSTRHSKIAGNFGEGLLLYWLSKHGFECATLDHTGIDLIARNPHTREIMGISVKSRARSVGTEKEGIYIRNDQFEKVKAACDAFGWFHILRLWQTPPMSSGCFSFPCPTC